MGTALEVKSQETLQDERITAVRGPNCTLSPNSEMSQVEYSHFEASS